MNKDFLKAFAAGFALSMLVIFVASKTFLHAKNDKNDDIFISPNNIALFIKNEHRASNVKTVPIKKIALLAPVKKDIPIIPLEKGSPPQEDLPEILEEETASPSAVTLAILQNDKIPIPIEYGKDFQDAVVSTDYNDTRIAMAPNDVSIRSFNEEKAEIPKIPVSEKETWNAKSSEDVVQNDPWVVAKGMKYPTNELEKDLQKNIEESKVNSILSERNSLENTKSFNVASGMTQNILIPIPQDIIDKDPLVPQLVSKDKESPQEKIDSTATKTKEEIKEKSPGLLKSITSMFSADEKTVDTIKESEEETGFLDTISQKLKTATGKTGTKILPTEMRLSFQPNRAEISGQTLKWIYAFAKKATEENNVFLEVRIDGSGSVTLQQRRLNLLQNILVSKGVDPYKIKTVFTVREPNSFIIRTVRVNSYADENKKNKNAAAYYYPNY